MEMNRRMIIAGTAAATAAAATAGSIQPAAAQSAPATGQAPGFYRYKIGDLQLTALNDGVAVRPLENFIRNAELPAVKAALDDAFVPNDKLTIPFTTIVVNNGGKITLIDTGNGDSGAPTTGSWLANFRAAGFDPAAVSTIVVSHFHGDHINGMRLKSGSAVFPNAEVMVPEAEWAFWMDDARAAAAPDAMKPAFANVRRVFEPIKAQVKPFAYGKEVVTGITAVEANGHTPGHTVFVVQSGSGKLLVMSDTANSPALFVRNPGWQAIFDMNADQATATRRKLLDMAATERMQVAFYHAPFPATGHIAKDGAGFRFVPVSWSPAA